MTLSSAFVADGFIGHVPRGLRLAEVAPGIDIERDILALLPFDIIVERPVRMDARIFRPEPMNLARQLGVDARSGEGTVV